MISATLDSSVYIRALHFGGPATLIIGHARAGHIRVDTCEPILEETLRVLREKFEWNGYMIHDARSKLLELGNLVTPTDAVDLVEEDPDDNRILECAMTAKSDFIVTEDNDLLRIGSFASAKIVNIVGFLQFLARRGERRL